MKDDLTMLPPDRVKVPALAVESSRYGREHIPRFLGARLSDGKIEIDAAVAPEAAPDAYRIYMREWRGYLDEEFIDAASPYITFFYSADGASEAA